MGQTGGVEVRAPRRCGNPQARTPTLQRLVFMVRVSFSVLKPWEAVKAALCSGQSPSFKERPARMPALLPRVFGEWIGSDSGRYPQSRKGPRYGFWRGVWGRWRDVSTVFVFFPLNAKTQKHQRRREKKKSYNGRLCRGGVGFFLVARLKVFLLCLF